jgi:cell division GTPase FtsZ
MSDGIPGVEDVTLEEADESSEDDTKLVSALKLFIAGIGQCGGNIANAFWEQGFRKVVAFNTNSHDMARLKIPVKNRLVIGDDEEGGAARDINKGRAIAEQSRDDIRSHAAKFLGKRHIDYGIVCSSAGGGTGPGGFEVLVQTMQDTLAPFKRPGEPNVGAILALPSSGEDPRVKANAHYTLKLAWDLVKSGQLSPLILLDNAKLQSLPGISALRLFETINKKIAQHIVRFNHVAALDGGIWQFDKADWRSIFTSGVVTFGVTPVTDYAKPGGIAKAVKEHLNRTVLLDTPNFKSSDRAGCICVGSEEVLDHIPATEMEDGFKEFGKMLADNHSILRGIYAEGSETDLVINTVIGNLGEPIGYLEKLAKGGLL